MTDIKSLIRPNILALSPYSTARDECEDSSLISTFLDANENPYDNGLNRYPDPLQRELRERISELTGIAPQCMFLGNGSDEAIDVILRVFCTPGRDNIITITPSYGMYRVTASINDVECREVALDENFELSAKGILSAADSNSKVVMLCSPNNPTGNLLDHGEITQILNEFKGVVVVDQAYVEFAEGEGLAPLLEHYPNLIILQTLSKAWGMAGLRIGMAFSSQLIVSYMNMVKYPYNINCTAQKAALEELTAHLETKRELCREIIAQREWLAEQLEGLPPIIKIYPSQANFLLIKCTNAEELYDYLIERAGVIVRNRSNQAGCSNTLRITIGTPQQNRELVTLIEQYQNEKSTIYR